MTTLFIEKNPTIPSIFSAEDPRTGRYSHRLRLTERRLNQAADDLDAAAKLLKLENWTNGAWCDNQGRMCAQGAIAKVATGSATAHDTVRARAAIRVADAAAGIQYYDEGEAVYDIMDFNDQIRWRDAPEAKAHVAKIRKAMRTGAKAARAKAQAIRERREARQLAV